MGTLEWRKKWLWDQDYIWELELTHDISLVIAQAGTLWAITPESVAEIPPLPTVEKAVGRHPSAEEWRQWYNEHA